MALRNESGIQSRCWMITARREHGHLRETSIEDRRVRDSALVASLLCSQRSFVLYWSAVNAFLVLFRARDEHMAGGRQA